MIVFHSVTKTLGRGRRYTMVLDRVDWTIAPGSQIVVLGQKEAGKSTLLDVVSGGTTPTQGWVERRALVSPRTALTRYALRFTSARQLIEQHSHLYLTDPDALAAFVREFTGFDSEMDIPVRYLGRQARHALHLALFFGTPFDYYLFDNNLPKAKGPRLQQRVQASFKLRRQTAGVILATSSIKVARAFGGAGAVLHRGHLMLFATAEEAIQLHEYLLIHDPLPVSSHWDDPTEESEEEFEQF